MTSRRTPGVDQSTRIKELEKALRYANERLTIVPRRAELLEARHRDVVRELARSLAGRRRDE